MLVPRLSGNCPNAKVVVGSPGQVLSTDSYSPGSSRHSRARGRRPAAGWYRPSERPLKSTQHRWLLLLLVNLGCGSERASHELKSLEPSRLSLTTDFDAASPTTAKLLAALTYARIDDACPDLTITADLDGTPFVVSPNGTGKVPDGCQLGYYLETQTVEDANSSTVTFRDDTAEATFTVDKLLQPRALRPQLEAGARVASDGSLAFSWPFDSDELSVVDAYFKQGPKVTRGDVRITGNGVTVALPSLEKGDCSVTLGALAKGSVTACHHADECVATIGGDGELTFVIEP